tara:strand:+ start:2800 stop:3594 length:795 start_codon:yes stop_codon:yes gene_type:complete
MHNFKYICGNAFKSLCQYSSGSYSDARTHNFDFKVRKDIDNDYVFVKLEYLPTFLEYIKLDFPFTLFTHNTDVSIVENNDIFQSVLNNPQVKRWYSQNVSYEHPKLFSIPIGLANPKWAHGNPDKMDFAINENYKKNNMVYCNFDIGTNPPERTKCLEETGLKLPKRVPIEKYLEEMGRSYFCLSPNGNGIDCHKHWEALYLKTIPIVTKSINIDCYSQFPFLVIDDWQDYKNLNLSKELYEDIWKDFDPSSIYFENYIKKIIL